MTKTEEIKDLVYYMSLPYTIILRPDDEGDFIARIEELPGCVAHGGDATESIERLREAQQLWIEDCLESNQSVPEPHAEDDLPSGKWVQRVPRTLHKRLTEFAKKESVSLNQLVTSMLSEAVAARSLRDHFKVWAEAITPLIKNPHHGVWGGIGHGAWGAMLQGSKTSRTGLLYSLAAAQKLIPTHAESTYETKAIARYKEVEECAKRRR